MSVDARRIEFDVEALLLSAVCLFLWLSLLSHDPADSLGTLSFPLSSIVTNDTTVYPPNPAIENWCGWFGAFAATLMVQAFGIGSLLIALGLTVLTIWMFRVQSNYVRPSRQIGWALVIIAVTTFVSLLRFETPLAPIIGPGGYLGATASTWLNEHFAIAGSVILTLTVFMAGLLLSTDYMVLRMAAWVLLGGASMASTAASATRSRVSIPAPQGMAGRKRKSDVAEPIKLATDGEAALPSNNLPPIRIRGKELPTTDETTTAANAAKPTASTVATATGLLGAAKSLASNLLAGAAPNDGSASPPGVSELETDEEFGGDSGEFADMDEEYDEGKEFDDATPSELRELSLEGETLQVRSDASHAVPITQPEPRVRAPKTKLSKQAERQAMSDSLAHLDDTKLPAGAEEYVLPGIDLLLESDDIDFEAQTVEVRRKAKILESTFKDFGFNVRVVEIETGPVIAQYEIELEAGLRLSKITSLSDDLAIALRVPSVRIVAPIPGKNTVGIEVPNEVRQIVRLREVIEEQGAKGKKAKIPLFLGKDVSGNALTADLATLPHLLIAGRTGTGKSVCLNAIIASILMTRRPDEVRMLMIDPKMVELSGYGRLPHLMHPVVTDMKKAEAILAWAVDKMEERYALLARAGVRHITNYNELGREELLDRLKPESNEEADGIPDHLPFIVIVADEMADLMMTAGKEVEAHIIRLAQKSRAVGIHLILATQKPTVDVITGLIKSNLPARIAFQVASRTDSRVVLDEMGADKLLGNGDMLFMGNGTSMLLRGQGTYLSDEEINSIVDHCSTGEQNFVNELVNLKIKEEDGEEPVIGAFKKRDELYEAAVDVVVREGRGSCSLLQRALGIGYGRAARLIDFMAEDGIVGVYAGSQAREVQISISEWEGMRGGDTGQAAPTTPPRSNKVRPNEAPSDASAEPQLPRETSEPREPRGSRDASRTSAGKLSAMGAPRLVHERETAARTGAENPRDATASKPLRLVTESADTRDDEADGFDEAELDNGDSLGDDWSDAADDEVATAAYEDDAEYEDYD